MKIFLSHLACLTLALAVTGCLFKSSTVPVRHFILAPVATNAPASASADQLSVGIGFVKMPAYLLRDSLAIRNGTNEIQYLENAVWGERLDQCFQRALAANLSCLLGSDNIYSTDWVRNQVTVRVFVNVQQFDVDTRGAGRLVAHWRISAPDSDTPLKSGTAHLDRTGPSPHANPEAIAATLSDLAADFSRDLAQSIRENTGRH